MPAFSLSVVMTFYFSREKRMSLLPMVALYISRQVRSGLSLKYFWQCRKHFWPSMPEAILEFIDDFVQVIVDVNSVRLSWLPGQKAWGIQSQMVLWPCQQLESFDWPASKSVHSNGVFRKHHSPVPIAG